MAACQPTYLRRSTLQSPQAQTQDNTKKISHQEYGKEDKPALLLKSHKRTQDPAQGKTPKPAPGKAFKATTRLHAGSKRLSQFDFGLSRPPPFYHTQNAMHDIQNKASDR
ncbi:hypothetical protein QWZ03_04210 [Chitinimonas viridis]|uniref:Uncharacterized protein n=1 Tax=Chitinimonas viridis TaxID=664880 RepID=A0ABT8B1I6_9NEIS|nr:hypothetical protein [Chitinimonas viridis]MDN3575973.1 hypothetical protein [Chitinimonas viridis]